MYTLKVSKNVSFTVSYSSFKRRIQTCMTSTHIAEVHLKSFSFPQMFCSACFLVAACVVIQVAAIASQKNFKFLKYSWLCDEP